MDKLTKIQAFCEVEIMRAQIRTFEARQAFEASYSAYDLSAFRAAEAAEKVTTRVLDAVLDILRYCSDDV